MPATTRKIINDPVYGFISIDSPLLLQIIAHPFYQRLRRIYQMAFAHLVYPGAVHTRLLHSLGAYHLMHNAIRELKSKQVDISDEEELGVKIAILLHDIGHGPFSHTLETELYPGMNHEQLSLRIMEQMNKEMNGQLDLALSIFQDQYPKRFLHQLVSGQLDVDRMDYLTRDSFFSGVSEGVIGYDRILKMLTVHNGDLMVEEKGIYSIEKFLVARRLMYWQVYLHKTVVSAEMMLVKIIQRARQLTEHGQQVKTTSAALDYFLDQGNHDKDADEELRLFCSLDDSDIFSTIKSWCTHPDPVLSLLCRNLTDRKLLGVKLSSQPFEASLVAEKTTEVMRHTGLDEQAASFLVFTGEAWNTTYDPEDEKISILFKDGFVRDISAVDNALIHQHLSTPVKKYYFCFLR